MPVGPYETFQQCVTAQMEVYRKKNPDWTEEHLKQVAGTVCYTIEQNTKKGAAQRFTYMGRFHSPYTRDGKHYALFRVITSKPSAPSIPKGKRWRPSYESLRRCLGTILEAPLIGPPETGHDSTKVMGHPVSWTMPDGFADVVYEITDSMAWEKLQAEEWHDVSPQVVASEMHPEGDVDVLDNWSFEHVAFVDEGAFKDVEVIDWWQGDPKKWYTVAAELSHGHTDSTVSGEGMTDGAPSTLVGPQGADQINKTPDVKSGQDYPWDECIQDQLERGHNMESAKNICRWIKANYGGSKPPADKVEEYAKSLSTKSGATGGRTTMSEQKKEETTQIDKTKEFEAEVQRLRGELAKRDQKIELIERNSNINAYEAEVKRLKAAYDGLNEKWTAKESQEKTERLRELVDLRVRAGICNDQNRETETKKYEGMTNEQLDGLIEDFHLIATETETQGPKAKFLAQRHEGNTLYESVGRSMFGASLLKPKEEN